MVLLSVLCYILVLEVWMVFYKVLIVILSIIIVVIWSFFFFYICLWFCCIGGNILIDLVRFFFLCMVEIYRRIGIFVFVDCKFEVNK